MCEKNKKILRVSELNENVPAWELSGKLDVDEKNVYIQCSTFKLNRDQRKFLKEKYGAQEVKFKKDKARFILPSDVELLYDL